MPFTPDALEKRCAESLDVLRELAARRAECAPALKQVAEAIEEMRRALDRIRRVALTDALTGIANRPAIIDAIERAIARRKRHAEPFSLIAIDLDGFKQVNDRHGHAAGDRALRQAAEVLSTSLRREDMAARIGGDEFVVLLSGSVDAAVVGERIRAEIAKRMTSAGWPVTASVGVVTFLMPPDDASAALAMVDDLLYSAKHGGKDQVAHRVFRDFSHLSGGKSLDDVK